MWSHRDGRLSTITQVKVFSLEMICCRGRGSFDVRSQNCCMRNGECVSDMPGAKSIVGNRIDCTGTWESHIAPSRASKEQKMRRRKYGDMAVGLIHIRGVDGEMPIEFHEPGTLEGISGRMQRDERMRMPYTELENNKWTKLALISERAQKEPRLQFTSLAHLLN